MKFVLCDCIFCRTPCKYPGRKIAFHVNEGSTPFWLSLLVEFEDAEGDIGSMHIREVCFFLLIFIPIRFLVIKNKIINLNY